jgi:signal transduction histidine kinase
VRLQTKLTLAFAAVALVPIAVLAAVARLAIADYFRGQFKHTLEDAASGVEREYGRMGEEVGSAVDRLARADDPLINQFLVELARGPLEDERRDELEAQAETEKKTLGFEVLLILDDKGEILAAPHFRGRIGDVDAAAKARARVHGTQLVEEAVFDGGSAHKRLVVEAAKQVDARFGDRHARVFVVGGVALGEDFLKRLRDPENARLLDGEGRVLAAVPGGSASPMTRPLPKTLVEFKRPDGSRAAAVEILVSDQGLSDVLALISVAAAGLAVGGLALALLLGAVVARRTSRPLVELAGGAAAVARGELDVKVRAEGRDEVGELGRAFNRMTAELAAARESLVRAERVAAWREIAQRIAHEIKNPLTPIQMAVETLQRAQKKGAEQFDDLFAESAKTILDEVARLKAIVAEFSSFARLPAPRLQPCDLGEIVESALALYAAGNVPLERALDAGLPPVRADKDQVTQVLLNLLENARDAIGDRPGGLIRVRTTAIDGRVELAVADNGPGLTDEARAKLFTPYFTTKARGTGLGLAIVHRIVTDHGGEIRVDGSPGAGAVFTVRLPRA